MHLLFLSDKAVEHVALEDISELSNNYATRSAGNGRGPTPTSAAKQVTLTTSST